MGLREYRNKRDFTRTAEPVGGKSGRRLSFVVQKHAASHLHYDFRLEFGGVMWSWAVPKGPCLDPKEKRLAVQVEDHPLDYRKFEGTIPAGQYGGGTVMVWDQGEWQPAGDPESDYRQGRLHFELKGAKLRGAWTLVRMGARAGGSKPQWLLMKSRDDEARSLREGDLLEEQPHSVPSGRTLEEIAAGRAPRRKRGTTALKGRAKALKNSVSQSPKSRKSRVKTKSAQKKRSPKTIHPAARKVSRLRQASK